MLGWLLAAFKPKPSRRKKICDGLWYRTCGNHEVIVEASPCFMDGQEDTNPISRESLGEFKRYNIDVQECSNEGEAIALRTVLWNMERPCPKCSEETTFDDKRCVNCKARLWSERLTFTLAHVAK